MLVLQLIPVRQVISYFFVDNQANEELVETEKGATKNFRFLDEDHKWLPGTDQTLITHVAGESASFFHYAEALPAHFEIDIQTPPPNFS